MLATSKHKVPTGPAWSCEVKWDGMRASASVSPAGKLSIYSRRGSDYTEVFPELRGVGSALPHGTVLDGEIVVLDPDGRPNFDIIQERFLRPSVKAAEEMARKRPATFVAFDAVWLAGQNLMNEPLDGYHLHVACKLSWP